MHLMVLPQYTAALRLRLPFKRASTHALIKLLCFPRRHDGFISMSFTPNPVEISLFCDRADASVLFPEGAIELSAATWRVMRVMSGLADIDSVGSIERLTEPLAAGGIPINYISTVDTDYVLVEDRHLERAIELLATTKSIYVEYAEDSPPGGLSGDTIASPPRGSISSDHSEDLQPCSPSARTFSCYLEPIYLAKLAKADLRVSTHTILDVFVMDESIGASWQGFRSITITEDEVLFVAHDSTAVQTMREYYCARTKRTQRAGRAPGARTHLLLTKAAAEGRGGRAHKRLRYWPHRIRASPTQGTRDARGTRASGLLPLRVLAILGVLVHPAFCRCAGLHAFR